MNRQDLIFAVSGIATLISLVATSVATSGQFEPATVAIMTAVATGCTGLVSWLAKPR